MYTYVNIHKHIYKHSTKEHAKLQNSVFTFTGICVFITYNKTTNISLRFNCLNYCIFIIS